MSIFRLKKTGNPHALELSMAGLKLGLRVLQLGGVDGELIATLAGTVGISGEARAVVKSETQAERFRRAAAAAGVLVEIEVAPLNALPHTLEAFDLVVVRDVIGHMDMNDRVACLQQTLRVLRVGGRCLLIEQAMRGGLGGVFSKRVFDPQYLANGGAQAALRAEGFRAVRHLAEQDGKSFIEGTK